MRFGWIAWLVGNDRKQSGNPLHWSSPPATVVAAFVNQVLLGGNRSEASPEDVGFCLGIYCSRVQNGKLVTAFQSDT